MVKKFFYFFIIFIGLLSCHIFKTDFKNGQNVLSWTLDALSKPFIGEISYSEDIPFITRDKNKIAMLQVGELQEIYLKIVNPRKLNISLDVDIKDKELYIENELGVVLENKTTYTLAKLSFILKKESDKKDLQFTFLPKKDDGEKLEPINLTLRINKRPSGIFRYNEANLLSDDQVWDIYYDSQTHSTSIFYKLNKTEFDKDIKNIKIVWEINGKKAGENLLDINSEQTTINNVKIGDKIKFFVSAIDDEGLESIVFISGEKVPSTFEGGLGTADSPFLIKTVEQLRAVKKYPDKHFRQIADINFIGTSWEPIEKFTGFFDGGNFSISNFKITGTSDIAFFKIILPPCKLSNIKLKNVSINGSGNNVAGLVAMKLGEGEVLIDNCAIEGGSINSTTVNNIQSATAGIIASSYEKITIEKCWNSANISTKSPASGIVGSATTGDGVHGAIKITDCYNLGDISSQECPLAGILCNSDIKTEINNCYNLGNISTNSNSLGGILESSTGDTTITNCYNLGNISVMGSDIYSKNFSPPTLYTTQCFYLDKATGKDINWFLGSEVINQLGDTKWKKEPTISPFPILTNNPQKISTLHYLVTLTVKNNVKDPNGAPIAKISIDNVEDNNENIEIKAIRGANFLLQTSIQDNVRYELLGWVGSDSNEDKVIATVDISKEVSPIIKGKNFAINFDANTGTGTMAPQKIRYDEKAKLSLNNFAKAGFIFIGWSESSSATTETYINEQEITMTDVLKDKTLYAVWTLASFTLNISPSERGNIIVKKDGAILSTEQLTLLRYKDEVEITALPNGSYSFYDWEQKIYGEKYKNPIKIEIIENITVGARYGQWKNVIPNLPNVKDVALSVYEPMGVICGYAEKSGTLYSPRVDKIVDASRSNIFVDNTISVARVKIAANKTKLFFCYYTIGDSFFTKRYLSGTNWIAVDFSILSTINAPMPDISPDNNYLQIAEYKATSNKGVKIYSSKNVLDPGYTTSSGPTIQNKIADSFFISISGKTYLGISNDTAIKLYENKDEKDLGANFVTGDTLEKMCATSFDNTLYYSCVLKKHSVVAGSYIYEVGESERYTIKDGRSTNFNIIEFNSLGILHCLYFDETEKNLELVRYLGSNKQGTIFKNNFTSTGTEIKSVAMTFLADKIYVAYIDGAENLSVVYFTLE